MLSVVIYISVLLVCTHCTVLPSVPILDGRIVGGTPAQITEAPYQVALCVDYWGIGTYYHTCGGSILSDSVILSAARCIDGTTTNRWRVKSGTTYHNSGGFITPINRFVMHPDFNSKLDNDIAILFLTNPLNFTLSPGIDPIPLPAQGQTVPDGTLALVTGWGTLTAEGNVPMQLHKVTIPIVNHERCVEAYSLINPITENMICAGRLGVGGQDACHGDTGGPLAINGTLIGITSWGESCGQPEYPGVWVKVSNYRNWIDSIILNDTISV